jgi:hypothetical protein
VLTVEAAAEFAELCDQQAARFAAAAKAAEEALRQL